MSFKANLQVAGKKYNILNVNYSLAQETDPTGRPSSQTRGGRIEVTVESTGETDIFEWMTNSFERKDGKITFIKRDSDATLKELNFSEGYVVKYRENFDSIGRNPLTETFVISAKVSKWEQENSLMNGFSVTTQNLGNIKRGSITSFFVPNLL